MSYTWKCHICGRIRSDDKISVFTKPLIANGMNLGDQNIRYCNDNEECIEKVKVFSFIKKRNKE